MLESLLLEPSIAALVFGLRRGADCRYVVERARALAIVSKHRTMTLEHVTRAVLDLPSFVETIARAGGEAERLRSFLDVLLRRTDPDPGDVPVLATSLRRVLYAGRFPDADTAPMTIRQLCIALAREDECERFWEVAGVTRTGFLLAVHVPS